MQKIGIISDTHGKLPHQIYDIFSDVDQIWHAGDIGSLHLIDELQIIAPVQCVCGNVDDYPLCTRFPEQKIIEFENYRFLLIHHFFDKSMHTFPSSRKHISQHFDAVIYGHTHIPDLGNGSGNTLFFNPGSPTLPRGGKKASVGTLTIDEDRKLNFLLHFLTE